LTPIQRQFGKVEGLGPLEHWTPVLEEFLSAPGKETGPTVEQTGDLVE
jgi:hypothetical protein